MEYMEGYIKNKRDWPSPSSSEKNAKSFAMMCLFVKKQGIAMTNNLAERQIRKHVIYRKKITFYVVSLGQSICRRYA